jgi:hypothetical protein
MSKEVKLEIVSAKAKAEDGSSVDVYYTGEGKGYSEEIDDAKIFKDGGSWWNTRGSAIYRMKETYHLINIGIETVESE